MQYWPRGVKKDKVDIWYKDLGTSKDLIKSWKAGKVSWVEFKRQYIVDLKDRHKQALIQELVRRSKRENTTLLCSCRDPNACHRIVLKEQIEQAR